MKNSSIGDSASPSNFTSVSLQLLLNKLLSNLPETIALNKIVIENGISSEFKTLADQNQVVPVIDELLTTVIANARNTCISITAEKFIDIVTLSFEDCNNYNGYALSFSLMAIERQARFIGGDITIQGAQKRVATVSFSFPDTSARKQYTC